MIINVLWLTTKREKYVYFSYQLYYSVIKVYLKKYNNNFDGDFDIINNKNVKISTLDEKITSVIKKYIFQQLKNWV